MTKSLTLIQTVVLVVAEAAELYITFESFFVETSVKPRDSFSGIKIGSGLEISVVVAVDETFGLRSIGVKFDKICSVPGASGSDSSEISVEIRKLRRSLILKKIIE